ncbi:MAG: protein CapI, partial [bacterium TMED80]
MKVQAKDKILVTGCAGFVGMHLCHSLLKDGFFVYGIDNMNTYYEKSLKFNRLKNIDSFPNFEYSIVDLRNLPEVQKIFKKFGPQKVVNLAAQAGVQYSIK